MPPKTLLLPRNPRPCVYLLWLAEPLRHAWARLTKTVSHQGTVVLSRPAHKIGNFGNSKIFQNIWNFKTSRNKQGIHETKQTIYRHMYETAVNTNTSQGKRCEWNEVVDHNMVPYCLFFFILTPGCAARFIAKSKLFSGIEMLLISC